MLLAVIALALPVLVVGAYAAATGGLQSLPPILFGYWAIYILAAIGVYRGHDWARALGVFLALFSLISAIMSLSIGPMAWLTMPIDAFIIFALVRRWPAPFRR